VAVINRIISPRSDRERDRRPDGVTRGTESKDPRWLAPVIHLKRHRTTKLRLLDGWHVQVVLASTRTKYALLTQVEGSAISGVKGEDLVGMVDEEVERMLRGTKFWLLAQVPVELIAVEPRGVSRIYRIFSCVLIGLLRLP